MPKPFDRKEARRDIELLLRGLSYYREWRILVLSLAHPYSTEEEIEKQVVVPAATWLAIFDSTKGSRCTQVTDEVRQWYSHTLAELFQIRQSSSEARDIVDSFLLQFEAEVGYSFQSKSGAVHKVGKVALKRGRITTEKQYYILKEIDVDPTSGLFTEEEVLKILNMLSIFENRQQLM
ncbi:MAG: hypothetical protein CML02_06660 [Pseudooceanicola sp.]|nr:hypothetical protein [Pseudooceanicola sp.]|tara:strand:- start:1719 stop:2252 length:534 start_codon:yes stop_codon:yes gene_type:complete